MISEGDPSEGGRLPPQVIVFAGPNGSGKSTINERFLDDLDFQGEYINADDIAKSLADDFPDYRTRNIKAAELANQRRISAMDERRSFAFETVMSTPEKIAIMTQAKARGYDVTLFFVTTSDPDLNVARIANRVARGGHSVEPEATRRRYRAAMDLLACAVEHADIAVVVDNSGREPSTVAIKNRGNLQEPGTDQAQWAVEKLIQPCQERLASLQKIESALSAQGVLREASKPDVADADASNGRQYIGAILELTRYHALQQTGENTYIVHDRSLIATTVLRKGERTTIAYVYDKGKILALHR